MAEAVGVVLLLGVWDEAVDEWRWCRQEMKADRAVGRKRRKKLGAAEARSDNWRNQ